MFTDRPGRRRSTCRGATVVGPHKGSVTCAEEKVRVDERSQQRVASRPIQPPQTLRLSRRQAESWHFDVLALNPPHDVIERLMLCCHRSSLPCSAVLMLRDPG
jgi:hypothetical protein